MQALTAPPRDGLTDDEVEKLLTGPEIDWSDAGMELLDEANRVVEDLSEYLVGGTVEHDGRATVHRSCSIQITRELAWGSDRVRLFMVGKNATTTARFDVGVFMLTTPQTKRGEELTVWDVDGGDLLQLLLDEVGDTWVAEAGTTYAQAIRDLLDAAGVGVPLLFDGTRQDAELDAPMVWALTDSNPETWLSIINSLLKAIGYVGLYVDESGNYRSEPYLPPAVRPLSRTFEVENEETTIVGPERTVDEDVWASPNRWRFIRRNMATQPVEGDGIYTVENLTTGAASQESIGRVRPKTVWVDAVDQDALVAQGDQIVAADMSVTRTIELQVEPLPIAGHLDVCQVVDGDESERAEVVSWAIGLLGEPGTWVFEVVR